MIPFLKTKNSLVSYSLIFLIIVPIFGFNFLINFIGNILLLILLVPLLIFLIALVSFNSLKLNLQTCNQCGYISFNMNNSCVNCGSDLSDINIKNSGNLKKPNEATIEIKAEEVK